MLLMKPELFDGLDTPLGLQEALQTAIELEHATIPAYLYAAFSLQPGVNSEIAELIRSIYMQEMAHMALACNLLNAIGGTPEIDTSKFIPTYPESLPGTVEHQLCVGLEAFSIPLVRKAFMVIEEPEHPIEIPPDAAAEPEKPLTIGAFYHAIKVELEKVGEKIFTGDPKRQVAGVFKEVTAVDDMASASIAIETIVEQGEGTATNPIEAESEEEEPAHFYRFAEIAEGHKLVPAPGETPPWRYLGEAIPFDPTKVYPAKRNPRNNSYPAGSAVRQASEAFNFAYTSVLKELHGGFNGEPSKIGTAIRLMGKLPDLAQTLMTIELAPGENGGPSFEYQATAPTGA